MSADCPNWNLTPEQRVAGKRIAVAFFVAKGLQYLSLLGLIVFMITSEQFHQRLTMIWMVSTAAFGLLTNRISSAYLTQITTGEWPKRNRWQWLWDGLLVTILIFLVVLSWR